MARELGGIACTGTQRGNFSITVGELSFQIACAAAQGANLLLCCTQLIGGHRGWFDTTSVIPSRPSVSLLANGA